MATRVKNENKSRKKRTKITMDGFVTPTNCCRNNVEQVNNFNNMPSIEKFVKF